MRIQRLCLTFLAFVVVGAFGGTAWADETTVNPTSNNFGSVRLGTTPSPTTQFTIAFTDTAPPSNLDVATITGVGAGCVDYSLSPPSGDAAYIDLPEAGIVVTVTFAPSALGSRPCTFTINDDRDGNADTFAASGVGVESFMVLNPAGTHAIGNVRLGQSSSNGTVITVDNTQVADLNITHMQITGPDAARFTFNDHGCTAGNNQDCPTDWVVTQAETPEQVAIVCTPGTNEAAMSATLTFTSDSNASADQVVALTCVGVEPEILLTPATTLTIGGGGVHVGSSAVGTVRVTNPSSGDLGITAMTMGGINPSEFSFTDHSCAGFTPNCFTPFTVSASPDFEDVVMRCTPAGRGTRTASLGFTGNQASGDSGVDLSCTGTQPNMTLSAVGGGVLTDPIVCATTPVNGGSTTCTFQINNTGVSNETLDWTVTSNTPAEYTVSAGGAPASAVSGTTVEDATQTITVTFNPTAGGTRGGTVTITGDDVTNPSITLTFTGTGTVPTITGITPALTVNLPNTDITVGPATTSTPATAISFTNQAGGSALQISSAGFTGGDAAMFTLVSGSSGAQTIAAGASASWTVTCTPTGTFGNKTTTFRVVTDAPGGIPGQNTNFTLNCLGLQASIAVTGALSLWPTSNSILAGTSGMDSVTLTNSGNRAIDVSTLTSGLAVFTPVISGGLPETIAAGGGTVTVTVTFAPINGATSNTNITVGFNSAAVTPTSLNIPVGGDGIVEGFDISITGEADPGAVNMGDLRVLTTTARFVTMQNSSDVAININAPTTNDSECVIARVNPVSYPFNNVPPGGTATFNINVTPDHIGGGTCTIGMTGLIPSTSTNLDEMIVVTWNGVAPELTLLAPTAGSALDFVGVDIDAAPMQLPVQLQNSGDFLLTITGCSISGPQAARFAVPSCATTVAAGGDQIFMVTYDPTVEALDGAVLTLNTDSFPVGTVTVDLEGVGIDQHINLPALSYSFPDTFRNPDDPPTQLIVVEDPLDSVTGQAAPLTITMAVTDASVDDVFVLPMEGPFTVDPGSDLDIPVEFRPTAYATFSGVITIFNDTTGNPMAQVQVSGDGISRNVTVSPGDIDLGLTGVNIPIRLSDVQEGGIEISNIDPDDRAYTVRSLALVDADGNVLDPADTPFSLDAEADLVLSADGTLSYDAEFAPTEEGEYEVTVAVFLDNDPDAHALVTLHGTAVAVELRGGGCQAGGSSSTGGLVVMALGLLALPWRRRGRKAALLAAAVVLAVAGIAAADPTRNVDLTTFSPAPATEVGTFSVESAEVGVAGAWALDLMFSHATNVLMVTSPSAAAAGMEADTPVSARSSVQLGFAYAFLNRFEAGLRVPVYQQTGTAPQFSGLAPADGTALGDVAAHGKANLVSTDSISLGASLDVTVPTATDGEFAGVNGPTGQLRGLVGWRAHRFGVNLNAGFLGRQTGELGNIEQGSALTFGGGAWFRALDAMYVIGETFGSAGMGNGVKQAEAVLGVRYEVARAVGVSVGAGRGLVHGVGSPDVRGFLLVDIAPKAREAAPLKIIIPPPPRDTRDDDADGVVNADDRCAEAEDVDEFQDDDGCPEIDNDEDGIPDSEDKCALEPEDPDGNLDEDGCIDGDNDGDGILDLDDKCPGEAEDKDGYLDSDGCDEVDNDSDGIPDVIDQCALEQETINGTNDDDGCPDNGDSLVMVMPDRIEIFEPVVFTGTSSTLSKKSANILGQVAATMRANRDFKRLRVTVHVHPRDNDDQALSDKRAKVVRDWLVQWGIEPERVEARGLGSTRPLVPKKNKGAAALNDRVEFIILEKEDVTPETNQP